MSVYPKQGGCSSEVVVKRGSTVVLPYANLIFDVGCPHFEERRAEKCSIECENCLTAENTTQRRLAMSQGPA